MLRQDRLLDINRYKRYREKGRISPRGNMSVGSSVGTASLSASPVSFSSNTFFGSSKSEDDQDSGVSQTYLNTNSLSYNSNDRDLLDKTRRQLQHKVERNRKLEKFEKFKRAKKTFELKKKLMEISYPSDPSITQLSQVSASRIGSTFGSSSYKDSVPKRITIVGSPSVEAKENQPIFTRSRQSVDPPRSILRIATQVLTPRKAPTPRDAPQSEMHPKAPIDPPRNIFQVATQMLTPRKAPTPQKTPLRDNQPIIPVDPPRNASLIVTQALTPRNAPTPRKTALKEIHPAISSDPPTLRTPQTPRAAPMTPRAFSPLNLPSMQEIQKQVEDRYDRIKREPPAHNVSTTSPEEKVSGAISLQSHYIKEPSSVNTQSATMESALLRRQEEKRIALIDQRSDQLQVALSESSTFGFDSTESSYQDEKGREIINVEDIQYSVPTTLVADPYQRAVEGSEEHPICLEEIIDLSDAAEPPPPPTPKPVSRPSPLHIERQKMTPTQPHDNFDYTFSPKMQRSRSTKAQTPSVRFDFTPSNVSVRPKSTSRARLETTKFNFSTPSPGPKAQNNVTSLVTTPSYSMIKHDMKRAQSASRLHDRNAYSELPQSFASTGDFPLKQKRNTSYQFTKTPERYFRMPTSDAKKEPSKIVMLSPESQSRICTSLSRSNSACFDMVPSTPRSQMNEEATRNKICKSEPQRQSRSIIHQQKSIKERFAIKRGLRNPEENESGHSNLLVIRDRRPMTPSRSGQENVLTLVTTESGQRADDEQNSQCGSPQACDSEAAQRTARMVYAQDFYRMIQKQKLRDRYLNKGRSTRKRQRCGGNGVSFVVRKRSITENEIDNGEYDVVNAETNDSQGIIVYETKVLSDLEAKELVPHSFRSNEIISSDLQTIDDLYTRVAQPLVNVANGGGFATIVMCGSDRSGKNENRVAIEEHLVDDIFESQSDSRTVSVQYVELCGKNCYDLLSPGSFVQVVDKEGGYFKLQGAKKETVSSGHEMLRMFSNAQRRLASRTNVRKQKEEKSFVLCQIWIGQMSSTSSSGCLTLLECPVSEFEGVWVPTVDTTKVKTTFDTLMQCISAKISRRTITNPFRNINNLTKLMKESFETKESRVCVLATISPVATETENTLTTLSSMCNVMRGSKPTHRVSQAGNLTIQNSALLQDESLILPRQWTNKQLLDWMMKKNLVEGSISSSVNGRVAMRLTKQQLNQNFYNASDISKASKLYDALRSENDRIARLRVKKRMSVSIQEYNDDCTAESNHLHGDGGKR